MHLSPSSPASCSLTASGIPDGEDSAPFLQHGDFPRHLVLLQPHDGTWLYGFSYRGCLPEPCRPRHGLQ